MPKLRFKGFSDPWHSVFLKELTEISTGKLDANAMVENGKFDFYTSGIAKFKIDKAAFQGPAITIAGNGATVGYMHLADGQFNAYQRTYVLTNFKLDRQFLFSQISRKLPRKIAEEARTGNIPYIVLGMLTQLPISFPRSKIEQEKIGSFLSVIDRLIEKKRNKVERLKVMKKGYLEKMFPADGESKPKIRFNGFNNSWRKLFLGEISDLYVGSSFSNELLREGNYIVMDMGSVSQDGKRIETKRTNTRRDLLLKNDLVMPKDDIGGGLMIGKSAYIPSNELYVLGDHVFRIRFKKESPLFAHYQINTEKVNKRIKRKVTGSSILGIKTENVLNEYLFFPSLNEQEKIGSFLSAIDRLIEKEEADIKQYESLKKGYLQKIFAD